MIGLEPIISSQNDIAIQGCPGRARACAQGASYFFTKRSSFP